MKNIAFIIVLILCIFQAGCKDESKGRELNDVDKEDIMTINHVATEEEYLLPCSQEDYNIYAAINEYFFLKDKDELIVILASLDYSDSARNTTKNIQHERNERNYLMRIFPDLEKDTIDQFLELGYKNIKLENCQKFGSGVKLLERSEYYQMHNMTCDHGFNCWEDFFKKFPDAKALVSFSSIGYSINHETALTTMTIQIPRKVCYYILLKNVVGKWEVSNKAIALMGS